MYKAIKSFSDLQDNRHKYLVGDVFPRKGLSVSKERIAELSTTNNRRGEPMIAEVLVNVDISVPIVLRGGDTLFEGVIALSRVHHVERSTGVCRLEHDGGLVDEGQRDVLQRADRF